MVCLLEPTTTEGPFQGVVQQIRSFLPWGGYCQCELAVLRQFDYYDTCISINSPQYRDHPMCVPPEEEPLEAIVVEGDGIPDFEAVVSAYHIMHRIERHRRSLCCNRTIDALVDCFIRDNVANIAPDLTAGDTRQQIRRNHNLRFVLQLPNPAGYEELSAERLRRAHSAVNSWILTQRTDERYLIHDLLLFRERKKEQFCWPRPNLAYWEFPWNLIKYPRSNSLVPHAVGIDDNLICANHPVFGTRRNDGWIPPQEFYQ